MPLHIQPLLLLYSYKCHTMTSVVAEIESSGVQIENIPGRCTCLCQTVDVGVGKSLKTRARPHLWEEWMVEHCTTATAPLKPPLQLLMSQWITDSAKQICECNGIVRNSWQHAVFSYFPNETFAAVAPAAADAMDNDGAFLKMLMISTLMLMTVILMTMIVSNAVQFIKGKNYGYISLSFIIIIIVSPHFLRNFRLQGFCKPTG